MCLKKSKNKDFEFFQKLSDEFGQKEKLKSVNIKINTFIFHTFITKDWDKINLGLNFINNKYFKQATLKKK